jgi:hypothetical protein
MHEILCMLFGSYCTYPDIPSYSQAATAQVPEPSTLAFLVIVLVLVVFAGVRK